MHIHTEFKSFCTFFHLNVFIYKITVPS
ncbi:hypothetical protein PFTANZ_06303 [Plasmodium falciparum Tanzania (2000708)]|uniref:Uncharacterized protein n=2 Tax=Plasmodium falciparum TaxID=5833 RepID=A0A024VYJ1_PLAFA|nr:hypothetical protein PFTANZ_06303 [Plasmodium falciparum Tanzania (2000708)]